MELARLRPAACHALPGEYAPGLAVGTLLVDVRPLPHQRPHGLKGHNCHPKLLPHHCSMRLASPRSKQTPCSRLKASRTLQESTLYGLQHIVPGSCMAVRVPTDTLVHEQRRLPSAGYGAQSTDLTIPQQRTCHLPTPVVRMIGDCARNWEIARMGR